MSAPAIAWADEQGCRCRLKPALRLVLLYLGIEADADHQCGPGQERIRQHTGLALRTIRDSLPKLAQRGLIAIEEHTGMATQYRLNIAMNGEDPTPAPRQNVPGDPGSMSQGAPAIGTGVTPAHSIRVPGRLSQGLARAETPPSSSSFDQEERRKEMYPPVDPPKAPNTAPPGGVAKRAHQLPATWLPNAYSLSLGYELGFSDGDIASEADAMRDWAAHAGKPGKDWDRRFNNWLRTEAKRRYIRKIRNQPKQTLAEEWGLGSFLTPTFDDDLPPGGRLQ